MSEKKNLNPESESSKAPVVEKKGEKKAMKEKKENWFVRTGKKIKKAMSDHPFWTAVGGAAVGSAATVGVAEIGKNVINKRNAAKTAYVPNDGEQYLDPNV